MELPAIDDLDIQATTPIVTFTDESADMVATLPFFRLRMTGARTGPAVIDATMVPFRLVMKAGEVAETILRYIKGAVR